MFVVERLQGAARKQPQYNRQNTALTPRAILARIFCVIRCMLRRGSASKTSKESWKNGLQRLYDDFWRCYKIMMLGFLHPSLLPSATTSVNARSFVLSRLQQGVVRGAHPTTRRFNTLSMSAARRNARQTSNFNHDRGLNEFHRISGADLDSAKAGADIMATGKGEGFESASEGGGQGGRKDGRDAAMVPPSHISPSSVATFRQCRQLFYRRHILRLQEPSTKEQVRGIVVHDVLSRYFDLPKDSRNVASLHEVFRGVMGELIANEKEESRHGYAHFFKGREEERQWAVECLDLIANFVVAERQNPSDEGDPEHRELTMRYTFDEPTGHRIASALSTGADIGDVADHIASLPKHSEGAEVPGVLSVKGVVDRIDRCADGKLRVVDYKTGKAPEMKYSEATNQRIMDEKFFQLQVYALLVERVLGEVPSKMRIVYLSGPTSVTRDVDPNALAGVEQELRSVWNEILSAIEEERFPPKPGRLCDWCNFKDRCPAFVGDE